MSESTLNKSDTDFTGKTSTRQPENRTENVSDVSCEEVIRQAVRFKRG